MTGNGEINEYNRVQDINNRELGTPQIGTTRTRHTTAARKRNTPV